MMEINMDPGVVWLFAFAAFLLAVATGVGIASTFFEDKSDDQAVGVGFLAFTITAVPWFVLLVWLFNDSPALQ